MNNCNVFISPSRLYLSGSVPKLRCNNLLLSQWCCVEFYSAYNIAKGSKRRICLAVNNWRVGLWCFCIYVLWKIHVSMAWCKTAVTRMLTHWSYSSLALSHRNKRVVKPQPLNRKTNRIFNAWNNGIISSADKISTHHPDEKYASYMSFWGKPRLHIWPIEVYFQCWSL